MIQRSKVLALSSFVLILAANSAGQDWRKLIPLKSTCEDIKQHLGVVSCKIPVSDYRFQNFRISINISEGGNEKWSEGMPKGVVTRIFVGFLKSVLLKDFEENLGYFGTSLGDFEILPDDDLIDSNIYKNEKKGISFVVRTWDTDDDGEEEKYVTSVTLDPPKRRK